MALSKDHYSGEMSGSLKLPPCWSPAMERGMRGGEPYTFKLWSNDVMLWAIASDVDATSQAAAVVLRLGGTARLLAREIPIDVLQNGAQVDLNDGVGPRLISGLAYLMRQLSLRFAPLDNEVSIVAISDYMGFRRRSGEPVDEVMTRFEIAAAKAHTLGSFQIGVPGKAWIFLNIRGIPRTMWNLFLQPLRGRLPNDDGEYRAMIEHLRHSGHLHESNAWSSSSASGSRNYFSGESDDSSWNCFPAWSSDPPNEIFSAFGLDPGHDYNSSGEAYWTEYWQDDFSSEASSEELDPEIAASPTDFDGAELLHNYLTARRKWRTFAKARSLSSPVCSSQGLW